MENFTFCAVIFGYFIAEILEKTIVISYMVAKALCVESYRGCTSSSAVAAYSGESTLGNFDEVAKSSIYIYKCVLCVVFLFYIFQY